MTTQPTNTRNFKRRRGPSKGLMAVQARGAAEALLRGRLLVVDPASGGGSSQPGYAVFQGGVLVDSGIIAVGDPKSPLESRLFELGHTLRSDPEMSSADVLIIEDVPLKRFGPGGVGSLKGQVNLHRSVGAVMASVQCTHFVPIHPSTWHAFVGPDYQKSDEQDAISMGECAIHMAREVLEKRNVRRRSRKK